jgi:hypothetical protein
MLKKSQVIKSIQTLPENFQAEDAIERIVFLEKIRIGLQQSEKEQVLSKDQAKKRLSKWLK